MWITRKITKSNERTLWSWWKYRKFKKRYGCICTLCEIQYNEIVSDREYWTIIKTIAPYKNTEFHYLIVLKRHISNEEIWKVKQEEWRELQRIRIEYGEFVFRHNGTQNSSVKNHLHFHIIKYK